MREQLSKISYYEKILTSKQLSPVMFGSLIRKVCKLRKELSLKASQDESVIIEDAIKFVQAEEKLMCMQYSDAVFGEILMLFKNDYARVKQYDNNKILLNQCKTSMKNVKGHLKKQTANKRLHDVARLEKQFITEDKEIKDI